VKERPILFSAPMVRSLLNYTKSQTRRVVKAARSDWIRKHQLPYDDASGRLVYGWDGNVGHTLTCPYGQPGDRLWVREAFTYGDSLGRELQDPRTICYQATTPRDHRIMKQIVPVLWRPSIHLPRWASRILLEVTAVRVERLQDISQADAIAEGAPPSHPSIDRVSREFGYPDFSRSWYAQLWEQINGAGSWKANPWVWVIEFKRVVPA